MALKPYQAPKKPISRAARMRNRCIVLAAFIGICAGIGSCLSNCGENKGYAKAEREFGQVFESKKIDVDTSATETRAVEKPADKTAEPAKLSKASANEAHANNANANNASAEKIQNAQATVAAEVTPEGAPVPEVIDSTHIKNQKDVYMAEKIDNLLRRFKPENSIILMVDAKTNEIIAWGERKDNAVQSKPDYFIRNTFPAASLAKTITIAAAMDNNRYALNSQIPLIGHAHHLYKNQLRVPANYHGPTVEMQDAYAHSYNPPLALIGMDVGAKKLKDAARKLGYNMNFAGGLPGRSTFAPPDTGYALAEASCGFTDATTLSPLQAAAQVRAILMKKPLEIPWASNLKGYAPTSRIAQDVGTFKENTYYGLRQAMIRSVTHGTARKNISTKHMARKNYDALTIGGKTGSLDGKDPKGRYDWFMGFAQSKEDPSKAIILVVLQIYDNQGLRPQPTTQVAGMLINYWAHQYVTNKKK